MATQVAVIVPIKPFNAAKSRLASALSPTQRAALATNMAETVLEAAQPLPVLVVCDHDEVAEWAIKNGATVLRQRKPGLNNAVQEAFSYLGQQGFSQVVIAHGDLPLAKNLAWLAEFAGITIVPDRHGHGTNVLSVPTSAPFVFGYGTNSFSYHLEHSKVLGLPYRVVHDALLGWDIDEPKDLEVLPNPDGHKL